MPAGYGGSQTLRRNIGAGAGLAWLGLLAGGGGGAHIDVNSMQLLRDASITVKNSIVRGNQAAAGGMLKMCRLLSA